MDLTLLSGGTRSNSNLIVLIDPQSESKLLEK